MANIPVENTKSSPFAGMTFDDAVQQFGSQEQDTTQTDTTEKEDPFAGLSFDTEATRLRQEEAQQYDETTRIMLGLPSMDAELEGRSQGLADELKDGEVPDGGQPSEEDTQKAAAKEAIKELAGEPSGFVSGRHQLPRGAATVEAIRDKIKEGDREFEHKVKFAGENFILSTADLLDFAGNLQGYLNPFTSLSPDGTDVSKNILEVDGELLQLGPDFREGMTEIIKGTYRALGQEEKLQEVETASDIPLMLMSGNLGGSGALAIAKKGIDAASGLPSTVGKFLREEFKYSLAGTAVGTGAGALAGGSIEDRTAIAEVANIGGMLLSPVVMELNSVKAATTLFTKALKTKEVFESDNAYGLAKDTVLKHLSTFVPKTELPAIQARMSLVERVQKIEPDFKPTVGNVIGTEESKQIQRITDTKNHKKASEQYRLTKAAVERLTARFKEETDPSQKALIASALRMYSGETATHVQRLQDRIVVMEDNLRRVKGGDTRGVDAGENIRAELNTLKSSYEEVMGKMFDEVDPDNTARFDARSLITRVNAIKNDTSDLERILDQEDTGYNFISKVLPAFINKTAAREGAEVGEQAYLSFSELKKLRTNLIKRAVSISRKDPTSNAPRILNDVADELEVMIDKKMISGHAGVKERYEAARGFARDEFYSRFTESIGGELLQRAPQTGDSVIKSDEIGPKFWRKGAKEQNIDEFQRLFSQDNVALAGKAGGDNPERLKELADGASEVARENLKGYALRTLQDALNAAPEKDPLLVLKKWKNDYRGSLDSFGDIRDEVDLLETQFTNFASEKASRVDRVNRMNNEIVKQYADVETSTVLKELWKETTSEEKLGQIVDDIYRSTASKTGQDVSGSDAYELLYPETLRVDMNTPEMVRVQTAMQDIVISDMINKSYNPELGGPSWQDFDKLFQKNRAKLEKVFRPEDLDSLADYGQVLKLMGTENKPISVQELNKVKDFMSRVGFSPASVLSRWYSANLGKVGPVYLATDALTRIFTGVSQKHFDRVYEETMYDLDGLRQVLDNMGNDESAKVVDDTIQMLKKQGVDNLKKGGKAVLSKLFNEHTALSYGRAAEFSTQEKEERDPAQDLLNYYLQMNDDFTGQPSRIRSSMMDRDGLENEPDIFSEIENAPEETPSEVITPEPITEPTDEVEPVSREKVVNTVYNKLIHEEGPSGDTTGAAETGELGVTESARRAVPGADDMSDAEISKAYLGQLAEQLPEEAPEHVQGALLDTAYNMGESLFRMPGVNEAVKTRDWVKVGLEFLDTATIRGAGSKGLAARRARGYNDIAAAEGADIIAVVRQEDDGTISYLSEAGDEIFSYTPKKGRHPSSKPGELRIESSARG